LPLVTERRGRRVRKGLKNMVTGENNELWRVKEKVRVKVVKDSVGGKLVDCTDCVVVQL